MAVNGRPNKYNTHIKPYFKEIEGWLRAGSTQKEIYEALDVGHTCWIESKEKYTEFSELVKKASVPANLTAKASLFKKVTGFEYVETKTIQEGNAKELKAGIANSKVRIEKTTKFFPPDTGAIIFWVVNKLRGEFQHVQRVNHNVTHDNPLVISEMTDAKLAKIVKDGLEAERKEKDDSNSSGEGKGTTEV